MSENKQLSLFTGHFDARIRRETHDGVEVFSLVDLMAEFSDTKQARRYWIETKKRLEKDGFQLFGNIEQLKMKAKDGKFYKTDTADGPTCLRIIQSIPSPKAEPIRQWLADLGYERLEEIRNPGLGTLRAKERDLALLKAQGYSNTEALTRLQDRIDGMTGYKSLMATVKQVCEKPRYGELVNAEYMALFGEIAERLKEILNTKSIRDVLPPLQSSYLRTSELSIQTVIQSQSRLSMNDILEIIDEVVVPLGNMLRTISDKQGVHHITGQRLRALSRTSTKEAGDVE
jgi:DNA-damage-inducible protein D